MNAPCPHKRTQIVSNDENGQFVECMDCHDVFESSEMEETEVKEDLSDA